MIKRYIFTTICIIAILVLSFFPVPEMPDLEGVPLIDKWTHMVMYCGLMLCVWTDWTHNRLQPGWGRSLITVLCAIALGGIIELTQPYVNRGCELMDFYADAIGSVIGLFIGFPASRLLSRVNKDNR